MESWAPQDSIMAGIFNTINSDDIPDCHREEHDNNDGNYEGKEDVEDVHEGSVAAEGSRKHCGMAER